MLSNYNNRMIDTNTGGSRDLNRPTNKPNDNVIYGRSPIAGAIAELKVIDKIISGKRVIARG